MLLCPAVKTSRVSLSFHVAFPRARYTPVKAGRQGQGRNRLLPGGFSPRGETGILHILPTGAELSVTLWAAYRALQTVLGVEDLVGKYESDTGFVPGELTF